MATTPRAGKLRDLYLRESGKIRRQFELTSDGLTAVQARSELVDRVAEVLWAEFLESGEPFCLVARGGYGRGTLFPCSDVDLLFLAEQENTLRTAKVEIGRFCQEMWDAQLRVSPTARTLAGCGQIPENNLELLLSLLDTRFLAGDRAVFERLRNETLSAVIRRERPAILQQLLELTLARHKKYANTIFHLEPTIKDCPGGLRDFDVACWLRALGVLDLRGGWPPDDDGVTAMRQECSDSLAFLTALRCFLHYLRGRDDNVLTWDAQGLAASKRIGFAESAAPTAAEWMRNYYRAARQISRCANQLLAEVPRARSGLYRSFLRWRSRVSNSEFSVVEGRVYLQQSSSAADPEVMLRAWEFVARHGLRLARDTEKRFDEALRSATTLPSGSRLWAHLREILLAPEAGRALRDMQASGLLKLSLPEFEAIDALVVRDFYHRYTVDEHTFTAIENLHRLSAGASGGWQSRFAELLAQVEQPELLFLALLVHDIGKSVSSEDHVAAGMVLVESVLARLELPQAQREIVRTLVASHLEMSKALRRDIFDAETIRALGDKVGSPEMLKMLCLLTYADISAVNPDALTTWKAENLWHLCVGTLNYLSHSADANGNDPDDSAIRRIAAVLPGEETRIRQFLEGLPRRYLRTHTAETMAAHFQMWAGTGEEAAQLALEFQRGFYELAIVTRDRPSLFATIAGALTAWGMDIVKASAFSNRAGAVVDSLIFRDRYNTLQLNPQEKERFLREVSHALSAEVGLDRQVQSRIQSSKLAPSKPAVATTISFDHDCSSHSTLLEVVTQDRPGLLYHIASILARLGCNIEIALIDTEGPMAVDVFYVTRDGSKLDVSTAEQIRAAIAEGLMQS